MTTLRRAIVVCRIGCDSGEIVELVQAHGLRVVHTVYTDTGPELTARIAVQHALDHAAEVVLIPYLTGREVRETPVWQAIIWIADLVTSTGALENGT
ncbi:hypothetical protein [Nocardia carnea]|uniref:hypothetical protein n=1 Tax=Nocardia carnea TaxID=37328 RepID=UPI002453DE0A|nr:hypothetical protein [Nocardia carnea]